MSEEKNTSIENWISELNEKRTKAIKASLSSDVTNLVQRKELTNLEYIKAFGFWFWLSLHNPFLRSVHVPTFDDYKKLSRKERILYLFWYKKVWLTNGLFGKKKDRLALESYLKRKYPIQWFLREKVYWFCRIKGSNAIDWVRHTLNPRQKWLTKQIPKHWSDKTSLIPEVLFAMVVHFIDGEKCFEHTDWTDTEKSKKFAEELRDCYDYIKVRRPELQKRYENSYPDEDTVTGDFLVDYKDNLELEALIEKTDTKYLVWIVTNRGYFWT